MKSPSPDSPSPGADDKNYSYTELTEISRHYPGIQEVVSALVAKFQGADPNSCPLSIPSMQNSTDWLMLMLALEENPYACEHLICIGFDVRGGRAIAIGAKKDQTVWQSETGKQHLRSRSVAVYDIPTYARMLFDHYSAESLSGES